MKTTKVMFLGLLFGLSLVPAVAGAQTKIVPAASVPDSKGSADVRGIARLGIRAIAGGTVPAGTTEGAAGPGELLLITGSNFGKAPTVTLAGQKVDALGRTAD